MRILFFITKSEQGGAQTHVAQLTKFFVQRGDTVMIMSAPGGWLEQESQRIGASFCANPFLANSANPFRLWCASQTLSQTLKTFQPDIVACHSTIAGLIGRFTIRNTIPTIFTAHGWGFTQGAPRLRRLVLPLLERFAGRFSSKIICVSQNDLALAQQHRIASALKLTMIHNGVEVQTPQTKQLTPYIHIFFVGRLASPKNPMLLITAFSRLDPDIRKRARITVIGDGPDRQHLQTTIEELQLNEFITLTGTLTQTEVLERLRIQADLFVLLSNWEGFPYALLEAMSAGVPVIASNVGGIPEALEYGGGTLVKNREAHQLTNTLAQLIEDPHLRTQMGKTAQHSVEEHFSVEQMCQKTLAVFHETLLQ
ncbi:glycosyltransferase family 4 protein [Candidatus Uhrbacteria bacterium]|nr:glycosyltransferase family 4 protein [Candidatus Uhrbacteria bacterium]